MLQFRVFSCGFCVLPHCREPKVETMRFKFGEGRRVNESDHRSEFKRLFVHDCGSENAMKTHLTLCLRAWNADASHTQNLAKLAWLRRPRLCSSIGELFAFALWRGLRHGCVSPSPCSFSSLCSRDALPFNRPMRNFKRNSSYYERIWHNFDRIELRRRSRRKGENSKRDRRSRADSVETLRMRSICVLNCRFDPHLCPKPHLKANGDELQAET